MAAAPSLFTAFFLYAILCTVCEFGEAVAAQFSGFDDRLCNCCWYLFPIEMQQMHLIFMTNTQRPVVIDTVFQIECTRETLKTVTNLPSLLEISYKMCWEYIRVKRRGANK